MNGYNDKSRDYQVRDDQNQIESEMNLFTKTGPWIDFFKGNVFGRDMDFFYDEQDRYKSLWFTRPGNKSNKIE